MLTVFSVKKAARKIFIFLISVVDTGCLSWISYSNCLPAQISDLGSRIQQESKREGKICCLSFSKTILAKILNYFIFGKVPVQKILTN
jgi:hypothetical protein